MATVNHTLDILIDPTQLSQTIPVSNDPKTSPNTGPCWGFSIQQSDGSWIREDISLSVSKDGNTHQFWLNVGNLKGATNPALLTNIWMTFSPQNGTPQETSPIHQGPQDISIDISSPANSYMDSWTSYATGQSPPAAWNIASNVNEKSGNNIPWTLSSNWRGHRFWTLTVWVFICFNTGTTENPVYAGRIYRVDPEMDIEGNG